MNYYNPRNAQILAFLYLFDVWVKAYLNFPFALLLDLLLFALFVRLLIKKIPYDRLLLLIMVFTVLWINAVKVMNGVSMIVTSRGLAMIFLLIYFAVDYVDKGFDIYRLIKYLKTYLAVLVFFVVADGIYINFIGSASSLVNIFGAAGYRILGNPVLFESVAQGILLGAQHASIISCAGIVMFYPFVKGDFSKMNIVLFSLSIFGLLFSVTNTSLVVFIMTLSLFLLITFRFSMAHIVKLVIMGAFFLVLIEFWRVWLIMKYDILQNASSLQVDNFIDSYIAIFLSPLENLTRLPILYSLIGVGHSSLPGKKEAMMDQFNLSFYHADFGYLNMVLEQGFICMVLIFLLYLYYFHYVGKVVRIMPSSINRVIMSKIMIVVNIFVLSGIHYGTITKNGILQFVVIIGATAFIMARRYNQRILNLNRNPISLS